MGRLAVIDQVLATWNQLITTEVVVWLPGLVVIEFVGQSSACVYVLALVSLCIYPLRILCRQSCGLHIAFYVFLSNLHDFGLFSSLNVLARISVQCLIEVVRADIFVFVPNLRKNLVFPY